MRTTIDESGINKSEKPSSRRGWLFKEFDDRAVFYLGLVIAGICASGWFLFPYVNGFLSSKEGVLRALSFHECAFKKATGLYCPGCGGTRSVRALLHGHFILSFLYHPFIPYCIIMWILYEGSHLLEILHVPHIKGMKFRTAYVWTGLGIILLNWIVKNILLIYINL